MHCIYYSNWESLFWRLFIECQPMTIWELMLRYLLYVAMTPCQWCCVCVQCCVANSVDHVPTAGDRERGERFGLSSSYHWTTQAVSSTVLTWCEFYFVIHWNSQHVYVTLMFTNVWMNCWYLYKFILLFELIFLLVEIHKLVYIWRTSKFIM